MNTISKVILYLILVKVVLVGILCLTKKGYSHINYSKIIEPNVNILDEEFYFYIRGHIRNSFETDRLKNFVNKLKPLFPEFV